MNILQQLRRIFLGSRKPSDDLDFGLDLAPHPLRVHGEFGFEEFPTPPPAPATPDQKAALKKITNGYQQPLLGPIAPQHLHQH